jgi:hypothetical protein
MTETLGNNDNTSPNKQTDRILAGCGYLLVVFSVFCFGAIAYLKIHQALYQPDQPKYDGFAGFLRNESATIVLLIIGYITLSKGKGLITTVRFISNRTIPVEDLPLVQDAVMRGISEPIDQYLRLRSLSGIAGNFTKLQITGLPLTTVFLTLIFSVIALMPLSNPQLPSQFLDLAKLTLGAFIGSFVQGRVEQRKQQQAEATGKPTSSLPPA